MVTRTDAATWPWPADPPNAEHRSAYADAEPVPFWLDTPERPASARAKVVEYQDAGTTSPCIGGIPSAGFDAALEAVAEITQGSPARA